MNDPQPSTNAAPQAAPPAACATCPSPMLGAEKILIGAFVFFVMLTVLLIALQSGWYYFTFALSLAVLLVTYKEGLVAMEDR
jgi:hypothetical protein